MTQENWHPYKVETDSVPMIDSASGKPLILRTFEFAVKPQAPGSPQPSRQQLFNSHWPQIKTMIWGDGLVANEDVEPRVVVGKKRYRIFILCEPKFRTVVADKLDTLQEIFGRKSLTKKK